MILERVTRAEAARELRLDRATITRWVQKSPALLDADGRVSLDELRRHRDEVVNPRFQTKSRSEAADTGSSRQISNGRRGAEPRDNLNETRNRTESAKATNAELDLAERLRMTLRRDDVEAAVAAAAEVLKQTAQALVRDRAEPLALIADPREMERALEDMMRRLLDTGAKALSLAAMATEGSHAT